MAWKLFFTSRRAFISLNVQWMRNESFILTHFILYFNTILFQANVPYLYIPENVRKPSYPAITCSKLTVETLEQGVKYVQS